MSKNRQLFEVFKTTGARKGKASAAPAPAAASGPIAGSESVVEARPIDLTAGDRGNDHRFGRQLHSFERS